MKYQLNKADRNRQKRLAAAIRKGLPLTGLLALLPLAGGCDEGTAPLSGDIAPEPAVGSGEGYCPGCGAPLSPGDSFCGVCGRRLRWRS